MGGGGGGGGQFLSFSVSFEEVYYLSSLYSAFAYHRIDLDYLLENLIDASQTIHKVAVKCLSQHVVNGLVWLNYFLLAILAKLGTSMVRQLAPFLACNEMTPFWDRKIERSICILGSVIFPIF